ncbi:MAG: hypothetical protein WBH52_08470 [Pseudomonas aeruginosa]
MYIHLTQAKTGWQAESFVDLGGDRILVIATTRSQACANTLVTRATVSLRIDGGGAVHDIGDSARTGDFDQLVSIFTCEPLHEQHLRVRHALALSKLPWILDQVRKHYCNASGPIDDTCREEAWGQHALEVAHA